MSGLLKNILKPPFKHKKLSDDFSSFEQTISEDGMSFACRELGSTFVTEAQEEATTADAIRRIVHAARLSTLKPRRVTLHISSNGIRVQCASTAEIILDTDIYDITYCSADAHYNHVFGFITTAERNAYECHAYLCHSAKAARTVSLSIAQAFSALAKKYFTGHPEIVTGQELRETFTDQTFQELSPFDLQRPTEQDKERISLPIHIVLPLECKQPELRRSSRESTSEKVNLQESTELLHSLEASKNSSSFQNSLRKNWAAFEQDPNCLSEEVSSLSLNLDFEEQIRALPARCQSSCSATADTEHLPAKTLSTSSSAVNQTKWHEHSGEMEKYYNISQPGNTSDDSKETNEKRSNWETFGNSSPLSSLNESWDFLSSLEPVHANFEWTSFSD